MHGAYRHGVHSAEKFLAKRYVLIADGDRSRGLQVVRTPCDCAGVLSDGWFPLVDRPRDSEKRAIKGLVRLQIVRHYKYVLVHVYVCPRAVDASAIWCRLADFFADVPPPTDEEVR